MSTSTALLETFVKRNGLLFAVSLVLTVKDSPKQEAFEAEILCTSAHMSCKKFAQLRILVFQTLPSICRK